MKNTTLRTAFRLSIPVFGAYWFLGITYGLLAKEMGYDIWVPVLMAMVVYSGSVEFIALTILVGTFHPLSAMVMALTVGARHLFYGLSMLQRWRNAGRLKPFLIYWMSDETFAVNYAAGGSYKQQLYVSVLDYAYWISGGIMGYALGSMLGAEVMSYLKGLDFVVTAMFVAIFMDQAIKTGSPIQKLRSLPLSSWLGIGVTALCLIIFSSERFIIPTMASILLILYLYYKKVGPNTQSPQQPTDNDALSQTSPLNHSNQ